MTNPYLILHKVRGEPAFDIAHQMECPVCHNANSCGDYEGPPCEACDEGFWWIVSTSGHRAYPHRYWELSSLADVDDINAHGFHTKPWVHDDIPDDLPDHYPINHLDLAIKPEPRHKRILERLGLVKPKGELRRI